jgi:endonuclease G
MKKYGFLFLFLIYGCSFYGCKKEASVTPGRDSNLAMGNPSNAKTSDPDNYLLEKPQYVLSYNCSKSTANWVSWHLSKAWKGDAQREDNFRPDNSLPSNCYKVETGDYTGTGFDRGHLCPSDDRDASREDNDATFLMTNIVPQSPDLNRQTWRILEEYCRGLVDEGKELYITSGVYEIGGTGSNGGAPTKTIAGGKITVPGRMWKVIVVLEEGADDVKRITPSTRIIAVDIPNRQSADDKAWQAYRVSVDAIETATGYDLLSAVPTSVQNALENKVDSEVIK